MKILGRISLVVMAYLLAVLAALLQFQVIPNEIPSLFFINAGAVAALVVWAMVIFVCFRSGTWTGIVAFLSGVPMMLYLLFIAVIFLIFRDCVFRGVSCP